MRKFLLTSLSTIFLFVGLSVLAAQSVKAATFVVNEGGTEADANLGDGICDHDLGTGGSQCTFTAARQEAANLAGNDVIEFDIPTTDDSYRDFDDLGSANSGDGADGDDMWVIDSINFSVGDSDDLTIDATTQTTNQGDTNANAPEIYIPTFITIDGDGVTIRGLSIESGLRVNRVSDLSVSDTFISLNEIGGFTGVSRLNYGIDYSQVGASIHTNHDFSDNTFGDMGSVFRFYPWVNDVVINNNMLGYEGDGTAGLVADIPDSFGIISPVGGEILTNLEVTNNIALLDNSMSITGVAPDGDILYSGNYFNYDSASGTRVLSGLNPGFDVVSDGTLTVEYNVMAELSSGTIQGADVYFADNYIGTNEDEDETYNIDSGMNFRPEWSGNDFIIEYNSFAAGQDDEYGCVNVDFISYNPGTLGAGEMIIDNNNFVDCENAIWLNNTEREGGDSQPGDGPGDNISITNNNISGGNQGIFLMGSSPVVQGNSIDGANHGIYIAHGLFYGKYDTYGADGSNGGYIARPTIGGQAALGGSCNGTEQNCISNSARAGITMLDTKAANNNTLYADNDFSGGGNGPSNSVAIEQLWTFLVELFSDDYRRTDLSDEAITLPLPAGSKAYAPERADGALGTLYNYYTWCIDDADSCPEMGDTEGDEEYTSIFQPQDVPPYDDHEFFVSDYRPYNLPKLVELEITGAGATNNYTIDFDFDLPHIVSQENFTFDGNPSTDPVDTAPDRTIGSTTYNDRGETWTYLPTGDGDHTSYDYNLSPFQIMEVELVDANPIFTGGEWVITVDSNTTEDNVSDADIDDGDGFYSGGGYEGPDGLANGLTSFREAMIVAEDFGQDVRINFNGSLSDLTSQLDVSLASPISHTITIDGSGYGIDGSGLAAGEACINVSDANGIILQNFSLDGCDKGVSVEASAGEITIDPTMFGSGISQALIDLEGGTEDADGITENDPGDADVGANSLQNSPEILSAVFIGSEQYRITGRVDGAVGEGPYQIIVCELGCAGATATVATGGSPDETSGSSNYYNWTVDITISGSSATDTRNFVAVATNTTGETSEFGDFVESTLPEPSDDPVDSDFTVTLVYPFDGSTITTNTPILDWNGAGTADVLSYHVYLNNQFFVALNAQTDYSEYRIPASRALADGTYVFQVIAYHQVGDSVVELARSGRSYFDVLTAVGEAPETETPVETPDTVIEGVYPIQVDLDNTSPLFMWNIQNLPENSVVRIVIGEYVDALGNLVDSREFIIDPADFPDGNFEFRLPDELLRELTYGWQIFVDDAEGNVLFESELYTFNVMEETVILPPPDVSVDSGDTDTGRVDGISFIRLTLWTLTGLALLVFAFSLINFSGAISPAVLSLPMLIFLFKRDGKWGKITSSQGDVLVGARAVLRNKIDGKVVAQDRSNLWGYYGFGEDREGEFEVVVNYPGLSETSVSVTAEGVAPKLDITMQS